MQISQDTQNVIDFLDKYSENTLNAKDDLAVIIEISATTNNPELLSNLIFTGASLHNSVISLSKESEADKELIKQETIKLQEKLAKLLNDISVLAADSDKSLFDKYLESYSDSLKYIFDISHDFSIFKRMQNDLKFRSNES